MKKKRFIILLLCVVVLVVGILIVVLRPKQPVLYKVTYLTSLGGHFVLPCSVNDHGQIVGYSQLKNGNYHIFLWEHEKGIQDLGPVNGTSYINNAGQIAATIEDPNGHDRAFIWDPTLGRCILPTLGGKWSQSHGINNHGQIVGVAQTASGVSHAYVWDAVNDIRDLTHSSTTETGAWCINDAGQAMVYDGNVLRLVDVNEGVISTSPSIPFMGLIEINNNGYVTGIVRTAQGKFDIGIWDPKSGITRLLGLNVVSPGSYQMSDVNQVIFTKDRRVFRLFGRILFSTAGRSFLEDPNLGRISLDKYVSISRKENFRISDINNKGCIIGYVRSMKDSRSRGVLLEPIPEQWNKK